MASFVSFKSAPLLFGVPNAFAAFETPVADETETALPTQVVTAEDAVAPNRTVPVPHLEPSTPDATGEFIVAVTAVLVAEIQPVVVFLVSA